MIEALHAMEAIGILEARHPEVHLLFTDIHMLGEMNGLDLAHHMRGHWPHIALLVTSGVRWPNDSELPAGSKFLRKPYLHKHVVDHVLVMTAH